MGCGSSSTNDNTVEDLPGTVLTSNGLTTHNTVDEYIRLDIKIATLEKICPGPRLATAEAWIDHLQMQRESIVGRGLNMNGESTSMEARMLSPQVTSKLEYPSNVRPNLRSIVLEAEIRDIAKLAINLGVLVDTAKAANHEDFFATLSQQSIEIISQHFYLEIIEHAKSRAKTLMGAYNQLSALYVEQDGLIALISGGTYMTTLEESIDSQLEDARDVRDKLGSALEQWRTCGLLLKASANSGMSMLRTWTHIASVSSTNDKIDLALDCRHTIQASLVSLECAQNSLPHVDIKFITKRQVLAVKHVNTYLITDIADKLRYNHTLKVLTAYNVNVNKATNWLLETFNKTLRKDFDKSEETVQTLAKSLRDHRVDIFSKESTRKEYRSK